MIAVNVTQSHIDRGIRHDCKACPLALAINERLRPGFFSFVGVGWIAFHDAGGEVIHFRTPLECRDFVAIFDDSGRAEPQFLSVNVPSRLLRSR
jgi:hypothetical protein